MKYAIAFFALSLFACIGESDKPRVHTDKTSNYSLAWLNQDTLLVRRHYPGDSAWIYSVANNQQTTLHFPLRQFSQLGTIHASANGESLFTLEAEHTLFLLHLTAIKNTTPPVESIAIPAFAISEQQNDEPGNLRGTIAFWVDNQQIYVEHYNLAAGKSQCQLYHVPRKKWEPIAHCLGGAYVSHVSPLGRDLYALYTSVEGDGTRKIVKWNPLKGITETPYPEILSGRMATLDFFLDKKDTPLYALSSHMLKTTGEVMNKHHEAPDGQPLTLYQWTAKNGFAATGFHVPMGVALQSVTSKKTAWLDMMHNTLCIGAPQQKNHCNHFNFK